MRWLLGIGMMIAGAMPGSLSAQIEPVETDGVLRAPAVVLHGGWAGAEADSVDAGSVIGIGIEFPLASWILLTPSVDRRTANWPRGERESWHLDFAVQGEVPIGDLRPYAGVGLGAAFDLRDDREFSEEYVQATYQAMGGVRWALTARLGLRGEVRWRFLDEFETGHPQMTAGISWSF